MPLPEVIQCPHAMQRWSNEQRRAGHTLGLVPTMGALHAGHLSLVRAVQEHATRTIVSIFVNPKQFNHAADLSSYPNDFAADAAQLAELNVDVIFAPTATALYPAHFHTHISQDKLCDRLCGSSRPGHFEGVCTVVYLLCQVTRCQTAIFGEKDFQQLQVIRRMQCDLWLPVNILSHPTVREADGLALSSRNKNLTPQERRQAHCLNAALCAIHHAFAQGETDCSTLRRIGRHIIAETPLAALDYLDIVDTNELQPMETITRPARCAIAVNFSRARLIDNIALEPQSDALSPASCSSSAAASKP